MDNRKQKTVRVWKGMRSRKQKKKVLPWYLINESLKGQKLTSNEANKLRTLRLISSLDAVVIKVPSDKIKDKKRDQSERHICWCCQKSISLKEKKKFGKFCHP